MTASFTTTQLARDRSSAKSKRTVSPTEERDDGAVTAEAIARRKTRQGESGALFAPYKNVIRMHLLIFFFAGVAAMRLENFAIYAVVYAGYFFPWRLVRRKAVSDKL